MISTSSTEDKRGVKLTKGILSLPDYLNLAHLNLAPIENLIRTWELQLISLSIFKA